MIVIDLLKTLSLEDLYNIGKISYLKDENTDNFNEEDIKDYVHSYTELWLNIRGILVKKNTDVVLIPSSKVDADGDFIYIEASLYRKRDILALAKNVNLERFTSYEEIFHLSPSAVEGILKTIKLPTSYAYEYEDWSNILGYEVFTETLTEEGRLYFIESILYEMSYFGVENEDIKHKKKANLSNCKDYEKVSFDDVPYDVNSLSAMKEKIDDLNRKLLFNNISSYNSIKSYLLSK